ncbi:MAG: hypothetical protein RL250_103 [Verrucomicrobiota bacterium]|jgi:hypothetical protein
MQPLVLAGLLWSALASAALEVKVVLPEQGVDDKLKAFAAKSEALLKEWEPKVADALGFGAHKGEVHPTSITIIFREMKGVAYWDGKAINVATQWVASHPEDAALVVHELTHVLQAYRKVPGWFTEGEADYIRFQLLEQGKFGIRLDLAKMKPRDSYRVTGWFLAQAEAKHPGLIRQLHTAAKEGRDVEQAFAAHCAGRTIDQFWADLAAAAPAKK